MTEWLDTGRHSRCPACLSVGGFRVRQVFRVSTEPFSLAGVQVKFTGTWGWEYRCSDCGAMGACSMKTPGEHGTWTDGLGNEPYE